jgi:hypothetical protein
MPDRAQQECTHKRHYKLVDAMKTRMWWCVYSTILVGKDKAMELTRREFKSQLHPFSSWSVRTESYPGGLELRLL